VRLLGISLLLAVGIAVFAPLLRDPQPNQRATGESVLLHDIGVLKDGRPVTHNFHVKNDTASTWSLLRISKSCACAHASAAPEEILPGQILRVTVGVDPRGKRGILRVDAYCLFDGRGPLHLALRADVQPYLRAVPPRLDMGHVVVGRSLAYTIRVDIQDGGTVERVSVSHPGVLVARLCRSQGQQCVAVSALARTVGRLPRGLNVSVHSTRGRIDVPVIGEIVPPVGLVPREVVLTGSDAPLPAYVWLRTFDPTLDQVGSVEMQSSPGIVCMEEALLNGNALGRLFAISCTDCETDAECVFHVRVGREVTILRLPVLVSN